MFEKFKEWDPKDKSDNKNLGDYIQEIIYEEARKLKHDREKAKKFAKQKGFDFPIFFIKNRLPQVYESTTIPTTYVIDSQGQIVISQKGMAKYSSDAFINYLGGL